MFGKKPEDFERITEGLSVFGAHSIANRIANIEIIRLLMAKGIISREEISSAFIEALESLKSDVPQAQKIAEEVDRQLRVIMVEALKTDGRDS